MSDQQNATQVVPQQTTAPTTDKKDANPNAAQTVADNTQANNEANPESKTAPLEGEELIKALVQQVETIFSRENLMSDYNIVSKMNGDMCVAIPVVLESPRISKLTQDASHLLTAMRQTTKVILDEAANTVKPSFKLQRNTIIIRDVAPDTPQEDLKNIFDNLKDKITGIHSDVGNTWFITFADEDSTTDAFLLSRSKQFQGKPVQARVKSENLLKSVYYQPPAQTYQAQQSQQNGGFVANRGTAGQQQNGATNGWWNNTNNTQRPPNSNYKGNNYNPNYKNTRYAGANPGRGGHTGTRPPRDVAAPTTAPAATAAPTKRPSRSNSNASRPKKPAGSSTPPLGPSHFPPLPTSAKKSNGKEVQQWTKEEILAVVTALSTVEKPEFNANLSDCPAIRETANTELDITKTLTVDLRLEVLEPKNKEAKRKQRSRANSRKMSVGPGDNPYAQEHRNRSKSITNKPQPAAAKQPVGATNSTVAKPNEKENHSNNTEHHAPVENHHVEIKPKTTSSTMSYADIARPSANSPQPVPQRVQKESAEQQAQAAQQAKQQQQKQQQQQQETKPRKQSDPNQFKRPKKTAKTNNGPKPSNTNAVAAKDAKPATAAQPKQAAATPAANKPVETATPSTAAPEVNSSEATAVTNNA